MRGRGVGALLLIAAIAVGCTGTPAPSRSSPHAPRGVPTPVVKPALVLTADLSDRPARWQLVTKISVGRTISTLGMLPQSKEEPVPVFPTAFAVARDGSLWFLDVVHKRLAHFSMEGQFLSEIRGVHFDRYHPHPRDMAMSGSIPAVVDVGLDNEGIIEEPRPTGGFRATAVHDWRTPVYVSHLVQGVEGLVGSLDGTSFVNGLPPDFRHPRSFASMAVPGNGLARLVPGIPLQDGNWIDVRFAPLVTHREGLGSTWFEAKFTGSQTASLLPIHFELKAPDGTRIPAAAGGELDTALPHGVACIIQMAPTRYRDAHLGNSRWFLELSDDGSPVIWERVPVPQIDDESVIRRLAVGPDHALYLMQVNAHEVSIYRR